MEKKINTIQGVIRAIEGNQAIVEIEKGGCGRCHEKGGCGGQHLTQMFCSGTKSYRVDNPYGAAIGEIVVIAIAAGSVRHIANLVYGFPLLGLIAGALLGMVTAGDLGAIFGGGTGIVLTLWAIRWKLGCRTGNKEFHPRIVSRFHS